jgi:glucose uptake protein GlcU
MMSINYRRTNLTNERGDSMEIKGLLQTIGTLTSLFLGLISIAVTQYTHNLENVSSPMDLLQISLVIMTIILMIFTGYSYYNSRLEYDGFHYFLYACLGFTHVIVAPITLVIAGMKIEFGEHWLAVLLGIICLIIWGQSKKSANN